LNSNKLKAARINKGYTQKKLADEIKIGETSYTKRENGNYSFSVDEVLKLKEVLNLKNDDIISIFFED